MKPFRLAIRQLKRQWYPYAAVHIRGGDGLYHSENWSELFPKMLNTTKQQILDYHQENKSNSKGTDATHHYSLVVVSDVKDLRIRNGSVFDVWERNERHLIETLRVEHKIALQVEVSASFEAYVQALKNVTGSKETDVYFDQLVAACADIAFVGSNVHSTFQERIRTMRAQPSSPC